MKNKLCLLGICLLAIVSFAAENPVLTLYPSDVKFYLSYDAETLEPDMATGEAKPTLVQGPGEFVDGVSGKAVAVGRIFFKAAQNIDLKTPGTVLFWVAPLNWPESAAKEPGFTAFNVWTGKHAEALVVGKAVNQPWGKSSLNAYMQFPAKHKNCSLQLKGNAKDWKNGEWHMLAVTWNPSGISYSVDGGKSQFTYLDVPVSGVTEGFYAGISGKKEEYTVAMDEFCILGKALTDEEIGALYAESRKTFDKCPAPQEGR